MYKTPPVNRCRTVFFSVINMSCRAISLLDAKPYSGITLSYSTISRSLVTCNDAGSTDGNTSLHPFNDRHRWISTCGIVTASLTSDPAVIQFHMASIASQVALQNIDSHRSGPGDAIPIPVATARSMITSYSSSFSH